MPLTLTIADSGTGGGFTASISGSAPGSLNTLLLQKVDGSITVSGGGFTSAGTRLSDGVISGTISPRYYWWYVVNNNAGQVTVSNFVYQNLVPRVNGSADAVPQRLIDYTVALINSLNLTGINNVQYKKIPYLQGTIDIDPPCVILTTFGQTNEYLMGGISNTNLQDDVAWRVIVLFITRSPKTDSTSPRDLKWIETVARSFVHQRVPSVPEQMTTDIEGLTTFDAAKLENALMGYQFSSLVLKFITRNQRGFGT